MTYAGVKSMIYCGVGKDDPRMKKALEWIGKNYTLDANPGMPQQTAQRGLYYYYHTLAKTLDVLGEDDVRGRQGRQARLAGRPDRGAGEAAEAGRQLGERDRPLDGGRPEPRHRLRPDGPELLQAKK